MSTNSIPYNHFNNRFGPLPRPNLHSWQENNADRHHQFTTSPNLLQLPPPAYKNEFLHPNLLKLNPVSPQQKKRTFFHEKFLQTLDYYCDTSSLHGLKYVGENRFSNGERFFWFVAFMAAVIGAIYFISNLYIKYDHSPVIVGFSPEMTSVENIPFPAVTICNTNVAFKSRAELLQREGTPAQRLILDDLCDTNTANVSNDDVEPISWTMMEAVILNVTQLCSEMFVGCKWQGKTYVCRELINSEITDDGYCCTFNRLPTSYTFKNDLTTSNIGFPSDITDWFPESGYPVGSNQDTYPYRAFGRGVQQGLTLILDAALHEYFCSTTNSFGFKIMFHTPRESPKIADLGFLIQPGLETRIAVDVHVDYASDSIRNIDYRKRRCFFAQEKYLRYYKVYNSKNCQLECEANYTMYKCGCTPFYLPRDEYAKICDKSDDACSDQARFEIERYGPDKLACNCLPGCSQLLYSPGSQSEAKLMSINNITYIEFLGNHSQDYFAENMAVVHIFFGAERYQVQVKTALYGFSEFLSNTGGLLGLFLGFSFLSVVEIIFFVFIRGPCVWCQNKRNKTKQTMFFQ